MTGFSADWLALREPVDARARSARLIGAAAGLVPEGGRVVDLGAGRGATMRALAAHIPADATFELVDNDEALLAEASRLADRPVTTRVADLSGEASPWSGSPSLVTASALFDLASAAFVDRLATRLAGAGTPLLSLLTYDGVLEFAPQHPLDDAVRAAFNTHQRSLKSFGPALGPGAPAALHDALVARGFRATTRETPWVLTREDPLMPEALAGIVSAARKIMGDVADEWATERTVDRLVIGHADQLFAPS